jgi:hypothetical protein
MRTEEEIKTRLAKVEANDILNSLPFCLTTEPVLAACQIELETQQRILKWVLDEKSQ